MRLPGLVALAVIVSALVFSCKKDSFITSGDAALSINVDSVFFDTVFTTVGSVTKSFKIFNDNKQKLRLSSVKLKNGSSSQFKINVDGIPGPAVNNIEIAGNDSIYVFVQVNVNPTAGNLPFFLTDTIQVSFNGNTRNVPLQAYGRNAHFLKNAEINGTVTWKNDLPYVITGQLSVKGTLVIDTGCQVYMHANAAILVDGSLQVTGRATSRVLFAGDRLDPDYRNFPASWPGIYFSNTSHDNSIEYALIRNAYQALALNQVPGSPALNLSHALIDNAYDAGVLTLNSSVDADNCLITNCGQNLVLAGGGTYNFTHCTVATYSNLYIDHKKPVLQVYDATTSGSGRINAMFTNCIFWGEGGNVDDEIVVNNQLNSVISFKNILYKAVHDPASVTNSIRGQNPLFDSINVSKQYFDFHLQDGSPAIDKGMSTGFPTDLDSAVRVTTPDLGCYEKR
jgi:hypothetical protein